MSENPITIFTKMKQEFLSYYNTQFYIENKNIRNERDNLVNTENIMWKWPQVELLSNYPTIELSNKEIYKKERLTKNFLISWIHHFFLMVWEIHLKCMNTKPTL